MIPAAINGEQFTAFTNMLTFDDFQISQDVYLQIYPILNDVELGNGLGVEDVYTPGPEESIVQGLNSVLQLSLSNPVLRPLENPDILAPTIAQTNAYVQILNYWGCPLAAGTNIPINTFAMVNFERYTFRCNKDCGTAAVWVQRTERGVNASHFAHYTIDSLDPGYTAIDDDQFNTVAGADYAVPSDGQSDYDFTVPTGWLYGTLTFPATSLEPEAIYIPITNSSAVEFDQDIELRLFLFSDEAAAQESQTPYRAALDGLTPRT